MKTNVKLLLKSVAIIALITMTQYVYPQIPTKLSTKNSDMQFGTNDTLRMSISSENGLVHVYKDLKVDGNFIVDSLKVKKIIDIDSVHAGYIQTDSMRVTGILHIRDYC